MNDRYELVPYTGYKENYDNGEVDCIKQELHKGDIVEGFLCYNMSTLTKTELATRLDTKPQTLAALFKKLKIYTPKSSQIHSDFLKKFDNIKMIMQKETKYINPKTNEEEISYNWTWTAEGAKAVVDHLINLGYVIFTENKGFKLVNSSLKS